MLKERTKRVHADARGRVVLGSEASGQDYRVTKHEDGRYTLTPVIDVPLREAWLHNNASAMASVQRGIEDAAAGRTKYLGSFAQCADAEVED